MKTRIHELAAHIRAVAKEQGRYGSTQAWDSVYKAAEEIVKLNEPTQPAEPLPFEPTEEERAAAQEGQMPPATAPSRRRRASA